MIVHVELWCDGSDEDRYYKQTIDLPFAPYPGLEIAFCPCCSPMEVHGVAWRHHDGSFSMIIKFDDTSRKAAEWHDHFVHMGFAEDEELRGCSTGPVGDDAA